MTSGNPSKSFPEFPNDANGIDLEGDRERAQKFLQNIQGNILKGHGRERAALVFFRFGKDPAESRRLLREAVTHHWVQSAWKQYRLARQYRPKEAKFPKAYGLVDSPELRARRRQAAQLLFGGLGLTTWGLAAIGCVDDNGAAPPQADFKANTWPESFWSGMKKPMEQVPVAEGQEKLTEHWRQKPYTDAPAKAIHGLFILACDNSRVLARKQRSLESWLGRRGAQIVHVEPGTAWRHQGRLNREPFGFVDGISQPVFFAEDRQGRDPKEWEWVDLKLSDVFITHDRSPVHVGGSFLAFLKFEQNVAAFRRHQKDVEARLGRPHDGFHFGAAFGVGRLRDGCPLHQAWGPRLPAESAFNGFDFANERDPATTGCPFHAHIRKMNPRVDDPDHLASRDTIIRAQPVRRGMVYDPKGVLQRSSDRRDGVWPSKGVGLLFMAYMADVSRQFELLHNNWAMNADFPHPGNGGVDGLLRPGLADWDWRGTPMPKPTSFVKRLGGHYLYVPSLPWLRQGGSRP